MNQRERLGHEIERLRKKLGSVTRPLSRDDLARMITDRLKRKPPMAGSTIMKWETGEGGSPDPWALIELARLAGVTVEEFVYPGTTAQRAAGAEPPMRSLGEIERMPEPTRHTTAPAKVAGAKRRR